MEAYNGLNGLRIASLAWTEFFEKIVKKANVTSQPFEPCLYIGRSELGFCCIVCYVDDLLMGSSSRALFQKVFDEIMKCVKVRQTGFIGVKEGGSLKFLGRLLYRTPKSVKLYMQVDPTYMDGAFKELDLEKTKGTDTIPDLKNHIEQTVTDQPLSAEAHSRYRRVLGRLAWLAQTRQDLLLHCSLLASGQASPKQGHEKALRALLPYLKADMNVAQAFRAGDDPDDFGESFEVLSGKLVVYSDAAFAPMRALQRRSISGCVIMYCGCLIKAFARHQASVTLSSCEAELAAIQGAVQEAIGIQRTLRFVVKRDLMIELRTDSMSGKQLLEASDVQRRSRHIEIRIEWLRDLMNSGQLSLTFVPGAVNPADMLTKCLPSADQRRYREV